MYDIALEQLMSDEETNSRRSEPHTSTKLNWRNVDFTTSCTQLLSTNHFIHIAYNYIDIYPNHSTGFESFTRLFDFWIK